MFRYKEDVVFVVGATLVDISERALVIGVVNVVGVGVVFVVVVVVAFVVVVVIEVMGVVATASGWVGGE